MKHYIIEAVGTFFLAMAISFTGNPLAIGLMLTAMFYSGAHISGGNFNPAVSFAFWMQRSFTINKTLLYMAAQTGGTILALLLFKAITGNNFALDINPEMPLWISIIIETLLTSLFCFIILTITTLNIYANNSMHGLIIGLTLTAIAFIGGIFNPAIALGSILLNATQDITQLTSVAYAAAIYVVGPLVGGALASLAFDYLNNK